MQLNWTDRWANETGFLIQRSLDGRGWETIARTQANATSTVDTTALAGRRYAYRVLAIDTSAGAPRLSEATTCVWVTTPLQAAKGSAFRSMVFARGFAIR